MLIVEDDPTLRRACAASLVQRRFAVTVASDGVEGLQKARAEPPDLVVLDLLMPLLPGIDMLRALKEDPVLRDVPVLVLSNSSREADRQQALQLGAVDFLVKANISLKQLGDRVEALTGEAPDLPRT